MPLEAIKKNVGDLLQSDGVQNLKTQATEGLSRAGEGLKGVGAKASEFAQSDELKSLLPYLLSGGAGAIAGGMATGRQRAEKGEDRSGYLGRVLRNALAAGGLAAGGHALINKGLDSTMGGFAMSEGHERIQSPLETTIKNVAFSPLTAAGAGAAALYATDKKPIIGAHRPRADAFLEKFKAQNPAAPSDNLLRNTSTAKGIGDLERAGGSGYDPRARRRAGLPSDVMTPSQREFLDKFLPQGVLDRMPGVKDIAGRDAQLAAVKGRLSAMLRRGPMSTFGQTHLSRAGRGSLGLAAAGVPALLGAFLTRE